METQNFKNLKPDWDKDKNLDIKPCKSVFKNCNCDNYILQVKGVMTPTQNAPEEGLIDIASLTVCDLYELFDKVNDVLEVIETRESLITQFKKKGEI
tara:strand:- start:44 stop:334 length:291 start_codon:yes stop_codon:yes gene_type:complete